jgi:hypothetical protein
LSHFPSGHQAFFLEIQVGNCESYAQVTSAVSMRFVYYRL